MVLPALTKDKKWTHDEEIAISVTWRATLYVTHFEEGMGVRKNGTDAGSKEIRVTGVAKSVKKTDLESLISKVNTRPIGAEFD